MTGIVEFDFVPNAQEEIKGDLFPDRYEHFSEGMLDANCRLAAESNLKKRWRL
jgi:hypothetical protein